MMPCVSESKLNIMNLKQLSSQGVSTQIKLPIISTENYFFQNLHELSFISFVKKFKNLLNRHAKQNLVNAKVASHSPNHLITLLPRLDCYSKGSYSHLPIIFDKDKVWQSVQTFYFDKTQKRMSSREKSSQLDSYPFMSMTCRMFQIFIEFPTLNQIDKSDKLYFVKINIQKIHLIIKKQTYQVINCQKKQNQRNQESTINSTNWIKQYIYPLNLSIKNQFHFSFHSFLQHSRKMERQKNQDQDIKQEPKVIHSGFTYFPAVRQVLTLVILAILEAEGIYLCVPFRTNTSVSFFIGQIILLSVTLYSWLHILDTIPGPMSELFKEDILKKAIEQGFNLNQDNQQLIEQNICTNCQIQKATQTYHCNYCNRSVYKSYFHSKWLNTCVSKENFPSFIAFLMFLFGYLILLAAQNLIVFQTIWDRNSVNFASFFIANVENIVVSIFLFCLALLVLFVGIIIVMTYYFALATRQSIPPVECIADCEGLNGKGTSNDKILHKIRQSIRQSSFIRLKSLSATKSHHNLFKETYSTHSHPFDLILKVFQQASQHKIENEHQNNQSNQNQDTQNRLFTDLFAGNLNLNKDKKKQQERKKLEKQMNKKNLTKQKWKNYRKSSFQKKLNIKRRFSMGVAFQDRNNSSRIGSLGEMNKDFDFIGQFKLKTISPNRTNLQQQSIQQQQQQQQTNISTPKSKIIKLIKQSSQLTNKLDDIHEKQSHLQDENYQTKSLQQKKQKEQQTMQEFIE